jgi:ABC-2 type transport system ATP-binding protein
MDGLAIRVEKLYKDFKLPHEKQTTLKGHFTNLFSTKRSRSFERQHALKDVSFEINKGEFFGIVGRNGSGKSTLLKLLAGIYQPTNGSVDVRGKLVPFIELGVGFNPELTGRENVFLNGALLGFSKQEVLEMYDEIVEFAELEKFMDQKLKNYSSGMQVRLAFSMAIRAKADILLVDEVLAVGDADFQRKCFDYFYKLKKQKTTVVFVTHDMNAVLEYCDRAILVNNSQVDFMGSPKDTALRYRKLFNDDNDQTKPGTTTKTADNQITTKWGDESASIDSVVVSPNPVRDADKQIEVKVKVTYNKQLSNPVCGIVVKNASGQELFGTNTNIQREKLGVKLPGQSQEFIWAVPNILSEGKYTVDVAVQQSDAVTVCEWWEDAAAFEVRSSEEKIPYSINPGIGLSFKPIKK